MWPDICHTRDHLACKTAKLPNYFEYEMFEFFAKYHKFLLMERFYDVACQVLNWCIRVLLWNVTCCVAHTHTCTYRASITLHRHKQFNNRETPLSGDEELLSCWCCCCVFVLKKSYLWYDVDFRHCWSWHKPFTLRSVSVMPCKNVLQRGLLSSIRYKMRNDCPRIWVYVISSHTLPSCSRTFARPLAFVRAQKRFPSNSLTEIHMWNRSHVEIHVSRSLLLRTFTTQHLFIVTGVWKRLTMLQFMFQLVLLTFAAQWMAA